MRTAGRSLAWASGIALPLLWLATTASAEVGIWRVTGGFSSLTISETQLASVGLVLDGAVPTADRAPAVPVPGVPRWSFAIPADGGLTFRTTDGAFRSFVDGDVALRHDGGLVLRAASGARAVTALSLLDFSVEVVAGGEDLFGRLRAGGEDASAPFEIRNARPVFHAEGPAVALHGGDLVIAGAWARATGRPELAGEWIGTFDLRLDAELVRTEASVEPPETPPTRGVGIDVRLNEVYGMNDLGRTGTYPTGDLGISFATTSCNTGSENVPWYAPMLEDHPFIGLAMFREQNGRMEQIGLSWLKHGFYALASDQCNLGCIGGGGGTLNVGCSDTYSISNNGSQYYLGPREEANPHTGVWHCLGSWFDGVPVDCIRSNDGNGLDGVAHRVEVYEGDLLTPGATYYYEGVYYVMDDINPFDNFMWREVDPVWTGTGWTFTDVGGGLNGTFGPLIYGWGDMQSAKEVAADDGTVILATQVTDLGGGQWHYEYALYNETSARGIDRMAIPVGAANVTAAGFRDIDGVAGTDWTFTLSGGEARWTTGFYGGPDPAHPLNYQTLYNFWFDADAAPQDVTAQLHVHVPGAGSDVFVATRSPGGATGVVESGLSRAGLTLFPVEPNPFGASTRVSFALGRERPVRLVVVDVTGRVVARLLDDTVRPGRTSLDWNGRDNAGMEVASGIYFFRLESEQESRTTKGILLR